MKLPHLVSRKTYRADNTDPNLLNEITIEGWLCYVAPGWRVNVVEGIAMTEHKGFHTDETEVGERCIARRAPTGQVEVWNGTGWTIDSDFAQVFPGQKQLDDYLEANPVLKNEQNLKVIKTRQ